MGRSARRHRERREKLTLDARRNSGRERNPATTSVTRVEEIEEELRNLVDGDAVFWRSKECPDKTRESHLEDILAFESVGTGTSMFVGLQENGIDLPLPEKLNDQQCEEKAMEILNALADLRIFVIGFEHMPPRKFYSTLWHQTLWEGCYVKKRTPGAMTIIDVSHQIPRSEMLKHLEEMQRSSTVH